MLEVCKTVRLVKRTRLRSLVVGGNPGSRVVVFPIPRVGLLEERPAVSGRREKNTTRRIAMSSGGRHSRVTGCENHEGSVGHQFGSMRWSFDSRIVFVPRN